jgi:hypothetical protein
MPSSDDDDSTVRRMPIERGPFWANDFKAWLGRKLNQD